MIHENVKTNFCAQVSKPVIDASSYVHPLAAVIGNVILGKNIMVAPTACVRGDEGQPIFIGDDSNIQDGVVIHALETENDGKPIEKNLFEIKGKKYAVYVGNRVSLAHQAQIHGPSVVLKNTFVGMKVLVFKSFIGQNCVIEPAAVLMGVKIPDGRYVETGSIIKRQNDANNLPAITDDYPMKNMNKEVIHVNVSLAREYLKMEKK